MSSHHFHYIASMASFRVKCASFHTQFSDSFECMDSTMHFHTLLIKILSISKRFGTHLMSHCFWRRYLNIFFWKSNWYTGKMLVKCSTTIQFMPNLNPSLVIEDHMLWTSHLHLLSPVFFLHYNVLHNQGYDIHLAQALLVAALGRLGLWKKEGQRKIEALTISRSATGMSVIAERFLVASCCKIISWPYMV